ncbi:MAG TPA: TaqI-like C-terminal specificity domain-containing protein [Candidatus Eisenbacteria bacterium]|nr:TaqI-like C-terminal specificity domain-containing protein [Candidatus Eisenbacteria bacterium]
MPEVTAKQDVAQALAAFSDQPLEPAALNLLACLGYKSDRRVEISNVQDFREHFDPERMLNDHHALVDDWQTVHFLFQLTQDEITSVAQGRMAFTTEAVDNQRIESYLFFVIHLKGLRYTRTQLASVTRAVNRLFPMPAMLLFVYGDMLTVSVINREMSKRDESRDVLRKVTLIKDISLSDPLRAHVDILQDLALDSLFRDFQFYNFVGLHRAWCKRLDTSQLNEKFYRDAANWYFWALQHPETVLPPNVKGEEQRSMFFIRLVTRLIFCWFLQEKGLLPRDLFRPHVLSKTLKDFSGNAGTYYRAILQNLFFATLNQLSEKRAFRADKDKGWYDRNRGATNLYRYRDLLEDPPSFLRTLKNVPFVNGGLFDCLDDVYTKAEGSPTVRLDGFSDNHKESALLPNELFFGQERSVDLTEVYQDARRTSEKVRGLIEILSRYKFTVEENTPFEEEIALDPELLGKVFENLLASYNEDTRTTARKATGSFYTPREVVSFMVDEVLIAYLLGQLAPTARHDALEDRLRNVFAASQADFKNTLTPQQTADLIAAIDRVKVLDPACGSAAFPMGVLHRLVDLLSKLDPNNQRWKAQQLERARRDRLLADKMQDDENRENAQRDVDARIQDIEHSFNTRFHALDFARKLYLIENCIYGTDIQPIACQIAKLRFFIALLVDQNVDRTAANCGVRPLPNLETRIVAADVLTPAERLEGHQFDLLDGEIRKLREGLDLVRHEHFSARTPERKALCREKDAQLRRRISEALQRAGLPSPTAEALARWDPYDQNAHAAFFDPVWMFSVKDGFDIVLSNPPWVRQEQIKELKPSLKEHYQCYTGTADLYVYFYERGIQLLKSGGTFSFISSNKWFRSGYGERLRDYLGRHTHLLRIIDFGDAPIFKAVTYSCIVVLIKREQQEQAKAATPEDGLQVFNWEPGPPVERFAQILHDRSFTLPQTSLKSDGWRLESGTKLKLLDRIRAAGVPLGHYVNSRFYYGIKTGLNEAFVIDGATRKRLIAEHASSEEVIKPFLRGRDVKRWKVEPHDQWLIFVPWHFPLHEDDSIAGPSAKAEQEFRKRYPAIYARLLTFKSKLAARNKAETGVRYEWYALQRWAAEYWQEFEQPKIIYPDIYEHQSFAWDTEGYYAANTCYFIPTVEQWLTGLLNSSAVEWFYSQVSNRIRGGYLRAFSDYMRLVPIPSASEEQRLTVSRLVTYLVLLSTEDEGGTQRLAKDYLEQLVNGLVYELFFPDELHAQKLFLFKYAEEARLPALEGLPKARRFDAVREVFDRLYTLQHPIRSCLFSLRALDIVRVIEGEA